MTLHKGDSSMEVRVEVRRRHYSLLKSSQKKKKTAFLKLKLIAMFSMRKCVYSSPLSPTPDNVMTNFYKI